MSDDAMELVEMRKAYAQTVCELLDELNLERGKSWLCGFASGAGYCIALYAIVHWFPRVASWMWAVMRP